MYILRCIPKVPVSILILSKSQNYFFWRKVKVCPGTVCASGKSLIASAYFPLYTICCNNFFYFQIFVFYRFVYIKLLHHSGFFRPLFSQNGSCTVHIAYRPGGFIHTDAHTLRCNNRFILPVKPVPQQILLRLLIFLSLLLAKLFLICI